MNVVKSVFVIIGAVIGAGFASGAEIFEYFAKFGWPSLFFVLPLFFCFYFTIKTFLTFGKNNGSCLKDQNNLICKKIRCLGYKLNYMDIFMFLTFFILCSAMFAGLVALFESYAPNAPQFFVLVIVIMFSVVLCNVSFSFLTNISYFIVPIIIICFITICVFSLNTSAIPAHEHLCILPLPILTILYCSQNMFLSSYIITHIGKNLSIKEIKKVSLFTSIILCLLIFFGILCFLFSPEISNHSMPFSFLASSISPYFSALYGFVIFFSIITTYLASLTSLKEYFTGNKKYNTKKTMLIGIALLSLFNFNNIVAYLYPLIGVFGVIFFAKLLSKNRTTF